MRQKDLKLLIFTISLATVADYPRFAEIFILDFYFGWMDTVVFYYEYFTGVLVVVK